MRFVSAPIITTNSAATAVTTPLVKDTYCAENTALVVTTLVKTKTFVGAAVLGPTVTMTVLTSMSKEVLRDEVGIQHSVKTHVRHLAGLALKAGLDGVVASAQEAEVISARRRMAVMFAARGGEANLQNCSAFFIVEQMRAGAEPRQACLEALKRVAVASRSNKPIGDRMILNAAFLVDRAQEQAFDERVKEVSRKYEDVLAFKYSGPWPPYNFVNIKLKLEKAD